MIYSNGEMWLNDISPVALHIEFDFQKMLETKIKSNQSNTNIARIDIYLNRALLSIECKWA